MTLLALPAFADNYIWMLHDGKQAVVVDPGDAAPVEQALDSLGLSLAAILVTHHHAKHIGGVDALYALPSSIALDLQINPFLRCREPEVVASAHAQDPSVHDDISVLATLREWKNRYR